MKFSTLLFTWICGASTLLPAQVPASSQKWEKEIAGIEKRTSAQKVSKNGVLFVGSSSIRLWKLNETFPEATFLNHGFGGSQIADSVAYLDRLVIPFEPRIVVFYAGDNDLSQGKTPETLLSDFRKFHTEIHAKLPQTKIIYLPVKPSPSRWKLYPLQQQANSLIKTEIETDPRMIYLDLVTPMLNAEGQPREELFVADKLHMNAAGYQLWSIYLRPHLGLASPPVP